MTTNNELITKINNAATLEDLAELRNLLTEIKPLPTEVATALLNKLVATNVESRARLDEVKAEYGYKPGDWLTTTEYAKQFGLTGRTVVNNWITRGIIPIDCVRHIPEWGTRLVRAIPYKDTDEKDEKNIDS